MNELVVAGLYGSNSNSRVKHRSACACTKQNGDAWGGLNDTPVNLQ